MCSVRHIFLKGNSMFIFVFNTLSGKNMRELVTVKTLIIISALGLFLQKQCVAI